MIWKEFALKGGSKYFPIEVDTYRQVSKNLSDRVASITGVFIQLTSLTACTAKFFLKKKRLLIYTIQLL